MQNLLKNSFFLLVLAYSNLAITGYGRVNVTNKTAFKLRVKAEYASSPLIICNTDFFDVEAGPNTGGNAQPTRGACLLRNLAVTVNYVMWLSDTTGSYKKTIKIYVPPYTSSGTSYSNFELTGPTFPTNDVYNPSFNLRCTE